MTLTLGTHFEVLLKNIRPPQDRLDAARDLPPKLRDYLKKHPDFKTLDPHSRLVGSYAQDLSVGDVKDVDFLVRVDGDPGANDPEAKKLIQDLKAALDGLPEALGFEGWAGVDIERARRSVHVYIKGRDFHFDVVPCIAPNGFDEPLWVPDRGFNEWIESHPVGFVKLLEELTALYGGKVRNLGRLLKQCRNVQMKTRQPKSYWLGAILVDHVQNTLDMDQPLAILFRDLLDGIHLKFQPVLNLNNGATPNIPDPLLGHNISWNWERSHFETFMNRIDDCRKWATKALDTDDRTVAVSYWRKIFGEDFPEVVEEQAKAAAAQGYPGVARVTGAGTIVSATTPLRTTPIPPTRFHGSRA